MSDIEEETSTNSAIKLRLPAEFKAEIESTAAAMHISVSAMTRLALAEYIKANRPSTEEAA